MQSATGCQDFQENKGDSRQATSGAGAAAADTFFVGLLFGFRDLRVELEPLLVIQYQTPPPTTAIATTATPSFLTVPPSSDIPPPDDLRFGLGAALALGVDSTEAAGFLSAMFSSASPFG